MQLPKPLTSVLLACSTTVCIYQPILPYQPRRYAATTALDFLAWCYVALQYNAVVSSARSLSGGAAGN